jgi:hypothetical protein
MIGYIVIIIIISIIVSIITEQMLIRRLKLEEGVTISKGKCILRSGYGLLPTEKLSTEKQPLNNEMAHNELSKFYKPII